MMRLSLAAFPLLLTLFVASCGDRQGAVERESVARQGWALPLPYDSVLIGENDDIYLGAPFSVIVVRHDRDDPRIREIWVSDYYANSILQFDGDGFFVRRIGQPGPGPHEFSAVTLAFLSGPDEVGAADHYRHEVKWFDRETGELRRFLRYGNGSMGRSPPFEFDYGGTRLVFPLLDNVSQSSLAILDLENEDWTRSGPFPGPYRRSVEQERGAFASLFSDVMLDSLDENAILVAFGGADTLYRFDLRDRSAAPLGKVPRLIRRGVEGECRFVYGSSGYRDRTGCDMPFEQFSVMTGAWVLTSGRIAVVHTDCHGEGQPPAIEYDCAGYLTVMDQTRDEACVDLLVPGGGDAGRFATLEGDNLYTLDRRITDVRVETWLLQTPVPSMVNCPEGHLTRLWLVPGAPD
jgi:hypothetical protein